MSSSTTASACTTFLHAPWKGTLSSIGPHHTSTPISQRMTGITLNHTQTIQDTWEEQTLWGTNPLERTPPQNLTKRFPRDSPWGRDAPFELEEVHNLTRRLQDVCEQPMHELYVRHKWIRQGASRPLEGVHPLLSLAEVRLDEIHICRSQAIITLGEYRPLWLKENKSTIQSPRVLSQTGKRRARVVLLPDVLVQQGVAGPANATKTEKTSDNEEKRMVPYKEPKTSGDETKEKNQTLESPPIKPTNQPKYTGHSGTKSSMTNEKVKKSEDNTNKTEKGPVQESNTFPKNSKHTSMNSNTKECKRSAIHKNQNIVKTSKEPSATRREERHIPWVEDEEITRILDTVYSEERADKLLTNASAHHQTPIISENECLKTSDSDITKANKDGHSTELDRAADSNKAFSIKKSMRYTHRGEDYKTTKTVSDNTPPKTSIKEAPGNKAGDVRQDKMKLDVTATSKESPHKIDISTREKTHHENIPQHYSHRGGDLAPTPSVTTVNTSTGTTVRKTHDESGMVDREQVLRKQPRSSVSPRKHGRRRKHSASQRPRSSQMKSLERRRQRDKQRTEVANMYPQSMYHRACASEREVKVIPPLRVLAAHPDNEPSLSGAYSNMSLVSRGTVIIESYSNIQNSRSRSPSTSSRKSDHHIQQGSPQKRSPNPNDSAYTLLSGVRDGTPQGRIRSANVSRKPSGTQSGVGKPRIHWQDTDTTGSSATKVPGRNGRGPRVSQRSSVNLNKRIRR